MSTSTALRAFAPIAEPDATCLILGSMPGVASLDAGQYYAHPRNAFWSILSSVFNQQMIDYSARVAMATSQRLAIWDVLQSCHREGSLDSNIQKEALVCNDFEVFFKAHSSIERILFNGKTAEKLFRKHVYPTLPVDCTLHYYSLPSTSPAMASLTVVEKTRLWQPALLPE